MFCLRQNMYDPLFGFFVTLPLKSSDIIILFFFQNKICELKTHINFKQRVHNADSMSMLIFRYSTNLFFFCNNCLR
jgi:hypothetical protein